jgi:hypothetical protein
LPIVFDILTALEHTFLTAQTTSICGCGVVRASAEWREIFSGATDQYSDIVG